MVTNSISVADLLALRNRNIGTNALPKLETQTYHDHKTSPTLMLSDSVDKRLTRKGSLHNITIHLMTQAIQSIHIQSSDISTITTTHQLQLRNDTPTNSQHIIN